MSRRVGVTGRTRSAIMLHYLIHIRDLTGDEGGLHNVRETSTDSVEEDQGPTGAGTSGDTGTPGNTDHQIQAQAHEPEGNVEGITDPQNEDADHDADIESEPLSPTMFGPHPTLLELIEHVERLNFPINLGVDDIDLIRALEEVYRYPFLPNDSTLLSDEEPEEDDDA